MASRRSAFRASRSSSRSEQIRSTRDDTVSPIARYRSMSWIPAANVSNVGARPVVMRERRDDTAEGGIGRGEWAADSWPGCESCCWPGPGSNDASMACCEGSNSDVSISRSGRAGRRDSRAFCFSLDGASGGFDFIEGIEGGRRSALRECLSRCNLVHPSI